MGTKVAFSLDLPKHVTSQFLFGFIEGKFQNCHYIKSQIVMSIQYLPQAGCWTDDRKNKI